MIFWLGVLSGAVGMYCLLALIAAFVNWHDRKYAVWRDDAV
jgi:hypothetical protein